MIAGKVVVVTGANRGLGLALSRCLAVRRATVFMAGRDIRRSMAAAALVREQTGGDARAMYLDLNDLASIEACAERLDRVDILVNNAAVMMPRDAARRVHGAEHHLGTNFLGHFALTAAMWGALQAAQQPRVVHVTSMTARFARLKLPPSAPHRGMRAYAASKLAILIFAQELARRARATALRSIACHPGYVATDLQRNMPLAKIGNPLFGQPPERGAAALEQAVVDALVPSGALLGPARLYGMYGPVRRLDVYHAAQDTLLAGALWRFAETSTGVRFPL